MYDGGNLVRDPDTVSSGPAPVISAPPLRLAGADDDEEETIVRGID
ncbi:hypothetical protein [Streptomyces sp. NPDC001843]